MKDAGLMNWITYGAIKKWIVNFEILCKLY